jgi:hypothetical protein
LGTAALIDTHRLRGALFELLSGKKYRGGVRHFFIAPLKYFIRHTSFTLIKLKSHYGSDANFLMTLRIFGG